VIHHRSQWSAMPEKSFAACNAQRRMYGLMLREIRSVGGYSRA